MATMVFVNVVLRYTTGYSILCNDAERTVGFDVHRILHRAHLDAAEDRAPLRGIAEPERDVEDRDLRHEVGHPAGRRHREVERAELQRRDRTATP